MLNDLDLPSLQQCREFNKLVFLVKIAGGMVPAINCGLREIKICICICINSCDYLAPQNLKDGLRLNNSVTISVQI